MMASSRIAPNVQIEVTTICNYRCFYCAGRDMPQRHMPMDRFLQILDRLGLATQQISLQGEGEPTAHPQFREMAEAVTARGWQPYTITNASLIRDPAWFASTFPVIGVSIDTLDPEEGERIGRIRLKHALAGLDSLIAAMGAQRIVVHTVNYGQPLAPILAWAKARGFRHHVVQPLQSKDDYRRSYRLPVPPPPAVSGRICRFLERQLTTYYSLDGTELPCCFIKDTAGYESPEALQRSLASGQVPVSCSGCREIQAPVVQRG